MRNLLFLLFLIVFLGMTLPAQAQLREHVRAQQAPAKLYGQEGPAFALNKLFSPEHFRMSHSYEMSFGSFGGHTSSLAMYTNSMMFQFNSKLAARVDLSVATSPFGNSPGLFGPDADRPQVFLQNAEVAYRPSENVRLHFSVRQSPYGSYMGPYGYGYGYVPYYGNALYDRSDRLFWNDNLR